MNKEVAVKLLFVILFSFIGLGVFEINSYLIVVLVVMYFSYDFMQGKEQLEQRTNRETKELKNEIKTTTKDAYLKHKQLITMISNIPSPLLLMDITGKVVVYNKYFNLLRKEGRDEDIDYVNNDCKREVAEFLKDAFIFEKNIEKNIEVDERSYHAIAVPVTTQGKFSGCVILFQDITIAKEKESMQKEFIADASHELKTPISVIKGMVEILTREDFDDDKTRAEFLKQIGKETHRLEVIVRDLLQLSRLSADTIIMKRKSIDFTNIIDCCIDSFTMMASDKNIEIEKEYNSYEKVFVDWDLCTTLINNLISNAIKYSDHGPIRITTNEINNEYVVSISDHGYGMSKEDCNRIFERFYRVDKARSRRSGGSGLGLSIVKSIVDVHEGRIEVESEIEKGTTFKIYFKY